MRLAILPLLLPVTLLAEGPDFLSHPGSPRLESFASVTYLEKGARYVQETYFVDGSGLRAAAKGHKGPALDLLKQGRIWSGVRMTFLVDISKTKRRQLVERNLRSNWPGGAFAPGLPEIGPYLDWQGRSLNQGDGVEYVFTPAGAMTIRFGRGPARRFASAELAQALRNVEYSEDAEVPDAMARLEAGLQALLH